MKYNTAVKKNLYDLSMIHCKWGWWKIKLQKNNYSMHPFMEQKKKKGGGIQKIYKYQFICAKEIQDHKAETKTGYLQEVLGNGEVRIREWERGIRDGKGIDFTLCKPFFFLSLTLGTMVMFHITKKKERHFNLTIMWGNPKMECKE